MDNRIFIFGVDGASYGLIQDLTGKGILPNFKKVIENGIFKCMKSSIPEISPVAWSSIMTGKNPAEHGILGFTDLIPGTYTLSFPNFRNMKEKPFWHFNMDKKAIIVNVPTTYPAKELNGFIVSGFVALDLEKAVYPTDMIDELKEMNYRVDADSTMAHKSKEAFLKDLNETLDIRMKLFRKLWEENKDWQYFMFTITGTDRLGHFFWDAYEDENHKYHKDFIDFYKKVDEALGEILDKLNDDDSLIIVSDHGFQLIEENVYVNTLLTNKGFLELEDEDRIKYTSITRGTKAFALDPGRIFINLEGRYPNGSVKEEDKEKIINELIGLFKGWEKDGRKIIKKVFKKEEIYKGDCFEQAADIILLTNDGFNLRGKLGEKEMFGEDIFKGMHKFDDAIMMIKTPKQVDIPKEPTVEDVVPIMKQIEGEK